jgi:DNA-binding CsgD family transcriptional regulator
MQRGNSSQVRPRRGRIAAAHPIDASVFEYIECIQALSDPARICGVLHDFLSRSGIEYFAFAAAKRTAAGAAWSLTGGRPHLDWMKRYFEEDYARCDPVLAVLGRSVERVSWRSVYARPGLSPRQQQMKYEMAGFGIGDGITIALPGSETRTALFSGFRIDPDRRASVALHAAALFTQQRLGKLAGETAPAAALSAREAECLCWAAQGKTDWEIGEILKLSESTVHWYIESAKRKLGVSTRIQAVVGAFYRGAIRL